MWCNGWKYCIKKLDEMKKTSYCGISVVFEVTNASSRSDTHLEVSENRYYGYLEDIIQCDFKSFKAVLTSTCDQFCHGKTWQYPRKSVDIATSKCFLFRGN